MNVKTTEVGCSQIKFVLLIVTLLLVGCASEPEWEPYEVGANDVYPGENWVKVNAPETLGWSSELLAKARQSSDAFGLTAVMIVQGGMVVDEWGEVAVKSNLHSVRKSLLSALIGIGVERGQIDLTEAIGSLGIDDNPPSLTDLEKQATVGDLLKARSGVYHAALYETAKMTASKPVRGSHPPGSFWHYNNWDFNTLGTIYEQQTGEKIFEAFEKRIAQPLQMQDFEVYDGNYVTGQSSIHPAYPIQMTARDLARFALLYLREGRWHEHQILSRDWIKKSVVTYSQAYPSIGYGYMWWTARSGGTYPAPPGPSYFAAGYRGQRAYVFPDMDLVVVTRVNTSTSDAEPNSEQLGLVLWLILKARPQP